MRPVHATPQYPFTLGLQYVADTVWVSIFPVLSTLVAPLVLTRLPQGQELLNTITDQQLEPFGGHWEERLHYGLFLAALFAWGLANWYGSRLLLQRDFMGSASGFRYHWNMWFPRLLAAFGMALIALYIGISRKQWLAGAGAAFTVVVFLMFVVYRRALFQVSAAATERGGLSTADRVALWLSLSLIFVLLCSFSSVNWSMARFLGAPVILFLGLGSLVMMGAVVLTYLPLSYGWPSLAWLPFVVAFLLGLSDLNRNHDISARVLGDHSLDLAPRPDVAEHFARWLSHHASGPIVLVAAEGGASRSAWWTSHVLSVLDYASQGEFSRHVYAVSGVSGGSLGAATYVALLAERGATPVRSSPSDLSFPSQRDCWDMRTARFRYSLPMQSECFLERDFLSPTLGYLLFPDLLQRIVPTKIPSWDRSLGLERSWQIDWRTLFERAPGAAPNPFAQSLDALYLQNGKVRDDIPVLFLNSARAQTGRSVLQSPVAIPSTELDDLFDARLYARGLPLSDVVHNSARFPPRQSGRTGRDRRARALGRARRRRVFRELRRRHARRVAARPRCMRERRPPAAVPALVRAMGRCTAPDPRTVHFEYARRYAIGAAEGASGPRSAVRAAKAAGRGGADDTPGRVIQFAQRARRQLEAVPAQPAAGTREAGE